MGSESDQFRRMRYWRRVRWLTCVLLSVWLLVTLVVPWYAEELSRWSIGYFPFDFWMSAQGAIMLYVVLIVAYAWGMDRLDHHWQNPVHPSKGKPASAHD